MEVDINDLQQNAHAGPEVLSVGELTLRIKEHVERIFPAVWVSGEVSGVRTARSGHIYFTLKDDEAQIRGVIWRSTARCLPFDLTDGTEVICAGSVDVYSPRGEYQLIVREIEPKGVGALQLALRQLQTRLAAEGLFSPEFKKPLPRFPRRIAFVTSPAGAAIRDFIEVLRRRWRGTKVLVIPARVQGDGAATEIAKGIAAANRLKTKPDILVVGRGGGSVEDLWCFNEEQVVRAIFASDIPVISAVGHEIDVTLSDLVADVRALTPSEAAELAVPSADESQAAVSALQTRMVTALRNRALTARTQLEHLASSRALQRPLDRIHEWSRRVDELDLRARRAIQAQRDASGQRLTQLAASLEALSPVGVLSRGYSLTQRLDGQLVTDAATLTPGEIVVTRLKTGSFASRVESTEGT